MSAVSEAPDGEHALLTAFLEATGKLDRRAFQRRGAISEAPEPARVEVTKPVNLEAQPTSTAPKSRVASFIFRRANLVKAQVVKADVPGLGD